MAHPDILNPAEMHHIDGFKEIKGFPASYALLHEYGIRVAERVREVYKEDGVLPQILGALCGSIVPLLEVVKQCRASGIRDIDLERQIGLVSTSKNGNQATLNRLSQPKADYGRIILVEDIVDEGGSVKVVEQAFSGKALEAWAPLQKSNTSQITEGMFRPTTRVYITSNYSTEDWIAAGGGLDIGSGKLLGASVSERARLALSQRLAGQFVAVDLSINDEGTPDYERQLQFFNSLRSPHITPSSALYTLMYQAERAKMDGDLGRLAYIAEILPATLVNHTYL